MKAQAGKPVLPMAIVLSAIALVEIAITVMYPRLASTWERIPVLAVILLIPLSIVGTFLYLLVRNPAHLYPPPNLARLTPSKPST